MANVKLTNVKKIYSSNDGTHKKDYVVAVHDFNLDIKDKEFVVFVGPSGCGKSTTLRMIAGLEDISDGTVEIDGEVVNDLQPKDRNIAMVFQNYALYPHMTVYDNIAFSLRLQKMPEDEIYERVTNAAEILGITEYLMRKPRALSGGQRQRVAIGRAMVRDSKVFLMDEPLSNLDAKLRNQMRAEIILLRQKLNTTFVYVTHDQTEAMTLGDRIVIMKDGYIMQVGSPTEVFERPKNLFVAGFIGAPQMNFIECELTREGGEYFVKPFGVKFPVDGAKGQELKKANPSTGTIVLGVRPEHIVLTDAGQGGIPCTLEVNEMMGSEVHLHVYTEDGTRLVVRVPTMNLSQEQRDHLKQGNKVYLKFESKVMHFFNKETEQNLIYA
ncbi:MAG: sn-glycerol-3-phosphate ABC transporter ATP-binding protein UgpC [Lachnospiraceae bacterium]|nr:sn-glycerol-3-phosphate ABC transporter ATP-binding protein UgpC [Lachnospiraceae bacterium]MBR0153078.1 sn-glycerol-3-phosphate ABC transporter ATP-binding protein UgpC [Lachnospiraceae bacterium]